MTYTHPVKIEIPQQEQYNRWLALGTLLFSIPKVLMLIPHLIVLYVLGVASCVAGIIGQFAVLFTGKYPTGLFDFVTGVIRWQVRVNAFFFGLSDHYPPFSLD